ncbi:MAG: type II toxin-antitoxin system Phd/YefM family antitoxin [Deltaproteobacteria bacterium]|nr:type II toxin-antitoxin system Phd/YefM family antitoxin [Deltaproteobacteria bacterium]
MTTLNATEARKNLYKLIDETTQTHEPIIITGKRGNGVLVSEDDWKAINETLYFYSVPGMVESIRSGLSEKIEDCSEDLDW